MFITKYTLPGVLKISQKMINTLKSTASVLANVSKTLTNGTSDVFTQQKRTAIVLRRMYPIGLYKKGGKPPQLKHRNFIYEVIENTHLRPMQSVDMILTNYVEGIGEKGDRISMKPLKAYRDFLLPGLAIYATPENIEKYQIDKEVKTFSSKAASMTLKCLRSFCVPINMSVDVPWTLEKWHIRANFRSRMINVTEESITMPEKEIKGPNLDYEGKEFYVTITINKTESVKVRCRLHHDSADISKQLDLVPDYWKIPGKAIFEEDQEVLDSMPKPFIKKEKKESVVL